MTQNMGRLPNRQLGRPVDMLAMERDNIIRAIDALISGI